MQVPSIVLGDIQVDLQPAPINPDWVKRGNPTARNHLLSRSDDTTACTLVWDCTPGEFEWQYDTEETIHILSGQIVLDDGTQPPRRLGPGDVVFFPAGARVHWTVEEHVRKLAFFRRTMPRPLTLAIGVYRWLQRLRRGVQGGAPAPQAGMGGMVVQG